MPAFDKRLQKREEDPGRTVCLYRTKPQFMRLNEYTHLSMQMTRGKADSEHIHPLQHHSTLRKAPLCSWHIVILQSVVPIHSEIPQHSRSTRQNLKVVLLLAFLFCSSRPNMQHGAYPVFFTTSSSSLTGTVDILWSRS